MQIQFGQHFKVKNNHHLKWRLHKKLTRGWTSASSGGHLLFNLMAKHMIFFQEQDWTSLVKIWSTGTVYYKKQRGGKWWQEILWKSEHSMCAKFRAVWGLSGLVTREWKSLHLCYLFHTLSPSKASRKESILNKGRAWDSKGEWRCQRTQPAFGTLAYNQLTCWCCHLAWTWLCSGQLDLVLCLALSSTLGPQKFWVYWHVQSFPNPPQPFQISKNLNNKPGNKGQRWSVAGIWERSNRSRKECGILELGSQSRRQTT